MVASKDIIFLFILTAVQTLFFFLQDLVIPKVIIFLNSTVVGIEIKIDQHSMMVTRTQKIDDSRLGRIHLD